LCHAKNGFYTMKKEEIKNTENTEEKASTTEETVDNAENNTAATSAEPEVVQEPDWKDQYMRTLADFDNFRRRTARDREEILKQASSDVIKDILPTIDNLALALSKAENPEDPFVTGVKLVYDGLLKALEGHGAKPIDSLGEPFDANYHEALAQLPSEDVPEGNVMNEIKRGWLLHGRLLRAAQVVVSSGKGE
jgi:molecular chaperone GrpE